MRVLANLIRRLSVAGVLVFASLAIATPAFASQYGNVHLIAHIAASGSSPQFPDCGFGGVDHYNYMVPGEKLCPGDYAENDNSQMYYQQDGNLVVYDNATHRALWASNTAGYPAGAVVMQYDGNFVMYDGYGNALWASGTCCRAGNWLAVQADENVVIYSGDNVPLWATNTKIL